MSFTRLRYHIVTVVDQRLPLIDPEVEGLLFALWRDRARKQHRSEIICLGAVEDHGHMIAAIRPTTNIAHFTGDLKAYSSKVINQKMRLVCPFKWQAGYGALTLNPHDMVDVLDYVSNQKQHHANRTLIDLYERTDQLDEPKGRPR